MCEGNIDCGIRCFARQGRNMFPYCSCWLSAVGQQQQVYAFTDLELAHLTLPALNVVLPYLEQTQPIMLTEDDVRLPVTISITNSLLPPAGVNISEFPASASEQGLRFDFSSARQAPAVLTYLMKSGAGRRCGDAEAHLVLQAPSWALQRVLQLLSGRLPAANAAASRATGACCCLQ